MAIQYVPTDIAKLILRAVGTETTDKKKLHKLLYYVQGWSLAGLGRPAFVHDLEAWRDGPVSTSFRDNTWHVPCAEVLRIPLENSEIQSDWELQGLIELIAPYYAQFSTEELVAQTHQELPWLQARRGIADGEYGNEPISEEIMARFFESTIRIGPLSPEDIALWGIESFGQNEIDED